MPTDPGYLAYADALERDIQIGDGHMRLHWPPERSTALAKLIDALLRKDTDKDGNWGYPTFRAELEEMRSSLQATEAIQKYPKTFTG